MRLRYIQILRGFAAIAVLLYHLDLDTRLHFNHVFFNFTYGNLGVDFFFALSGFIITYIHLKDIEQKGSVRNFLVKRAVRIYPLYWLVLPLAIFLQSPDFIDKPELKTVLTTWDGILKNIFLLPEKGEHMPVGVAWSLKYELFFYAVFALNMLFGWKFARVFFFGWVAIILIGSRDLFDKNLWLELLFGNIVIEFLAGCVVGYLFVKGKEISFKWLVPALIGIAGCFIIYLGRYELNRWSIVTTFTIGVASALIIWYAATADKRGNSKYALPLLVLIGDASYSIYITHPLYTGRLCELANRIVDVSLLNIWWQNAIIILIFIVCLATGILIHLVVERPVLKFFRERFHVQSRAKAVPV
ncbi:MAG: acyltransferase [Chitinophagaceae bacterium]|nr:acyltransferase [Chitinophagaceae bacterium]